MTSSRTAIGAVAAAIVLLAAPGGAGAEYLVPPSNSAATQYTETIPTGGGKRDAERSDSLKARDPDKMLGSSNAKQLEAEGQAGREAAELAAATAPSLAGGPGGGDGPTGGDDSPGSGAEPSSGNGQTSGSSAIGEVANQAIGSPSSGQMGMFLPLLIVVALLWSLWYLLRQRQDRTT